jgi:ATP-binding cassette, subfamily B, bacterial
MTRSRSSDFGLYRRLARQARSSWPHISALFLVSLLASPLALLTPLPLKIAVDSVLGSHPLPGFLAGVVPAAVTRSPTLLLVFVAALALLIALLSQLQALTSKYLTAVAGERLVLDFRARIFRQLQRISLSYHDSTGAADSLYRIQIDAAVIRYLVVDGFIPSVSAVITLAGMIYVMIRMDWQLTLVALAVSPPILLVTRAYRPRLRSQSKEVKKLESAAMAVVHEVLGALRVVKAFGQEEREGERFVRRSSEGMGRRIRLALAEGQFNGIVGLTTAAGTAAVLFVGIGHVRSGVLSLGDLLLVMGYVGKLYDPIKTLSKKAATLQGHLASVERVFSLLDQQPDVTQREDARSIARADGALAFRQVSFAYGPDRRVLHDISFEIAPGTRLGIVGATGAGKSTLMSLLTRFYDPTEGQILLDEVDLRDYRLDELRRQFAVVLQDPVLFSVSIGENIAYAVPEASQDQIVAAAQAANAHEFIDRLPQGYQTQVGERGVKLSGGQRQRISLARAFLKDSPVLILDEPTSAVDSDTEAEIVDALERLKRGRTVIIISHRPTTLAGCSSVLVLDRGRIVADTDTSRPLPVAVTPPPVVGAKTTPANRRPSLLAHPAVQAWRQLRPDGPVPHLIAPAKVKREKSTSVYRLEGAGRDGATVMAKRCQRATGVVEQTVYEQFLPRMPLAVAGYHGCVEDSDHTWLFIDELRGEEYFHLLARHRILAARWLAVLHTHAPPVAPPAASTRLPDAGPTRYLEHLRLGRSFIRAHLDSPVLADDDVMFLENLLSHLDDLEKCWDRLEEACALMPQTLVHGDFNGKNVRVREAGANSGLVVFDWEDSGWGVPAVDLAQLRLPASRISASPDIATYWTIVRDHWPDLERADLERVASCGTVFRALAALDWDSRHLAHEWAQRFVGSMRMYDAELAHALDRLGCPLRASPPRTQEVIRA